MLQVFNSPHGIMRAIMPYVGYDVRRDYANMVANMLPACDELYLYVCVGIFSVITDYTAATWLHDHTGGKLYNVRCVDDGYLICDID